VVYLLLFEPYAAKVEYHIKRNFPQIMVHSCLCHFSLFFAVTSVLPHVFIEWCCYIKSKASQELLSFDLYIFVVKVILNSRKRDNLFLNVTAM